MKKKILVTGGAGFIGSALVRMMLDRGRYSILNVDKLTYAGNLESLAPCEDNAGYSFSRTDICDRGALDELFARHKPVGIIHLAAESHVDRSIHAADDFIQSNIVGTFTLLEAARAYWSKLPELERQSFRFHHVSTDEVFGSLGDSGSFAETTPYDPRSPYSASKASSDQLVRAWHHTYALPTLITNCSNNYGPRQFPEKLIPLMILNAVKGNPLPIYGKGENVRDWLYVDDHARAIELVFEHGRVGETYCIGGGAEKTNIEVVDAICGILDQLQPRADGKSYREQKTFVADRPGHDLRYAIDAGKIARELGWAPQENFESGLAKTVAWYLSNPDWVSHIESGEYRRWIERNYGNRT